MRSKELVSKAIRGKDVEIVSSSDGLAKTVTGKIVEGKGPVLYVDGKEASLRTIEAEHGRSPLFDPGAADLSDWSFEEA